MDWIQHELINHESMKCGLIKQHNVTKSITGKIHNMEKKTTKWKRIRQKIQIIYKGVALSLFYTNVSLKKL